MSKSPATLTVPEMVESTKKDTQQSVNVPSSLIQSVLEKIFQFKVKVYSGTLQKANYKVWPKRMKQQESYDIGVLVQQVDSVRDVMLCEGLKHKSVKNTSVSVVQTEQTLEKVEAKSSFHFIVGEVCTNDSELQTVLEKLENDCTLMRIIFDKNLVEEVLSCAVLCTVGTSTNQVKDLVLSKPTKFSHLNRLVVLRKLIHVTYGTISQVKKDIPAPSIVIPPQIKSSDLSVNEKSAAKSQSQSQPKPIKGNDGEKSPNKIVEGILAQLNTENKVKAELEGKLLQCNQRKELLLEKLIAQLFIQQNYPQSEQSNATSALTPNNDIGDTTGEEGSSVVKKLTKKERNKLFQERKIEEKRLLKLQQASEIEEGQNLEAVVISSETNENAEDGNNSDEVETAEDVDETSDVDNDEEDSQNDEELAQENN